MSDDGKWWHKNHKTGEIEYRALTRGERAANAALWVFIFGIPAALLVFVFLLACGVVR